MNHQLKSHLQTVENDKQVHRRVIQVLNPPKFPYEPVQPIKQSFWMHDISRSEKPNELLWLGITVIACALIVAAVIFAIANGGIREVGR